MDKKLFLTPFLILSLIGILMLYGLELLIKDWQLDQQREELLQIAHSVAEVVITKDLSNKAPQLKSTTDNIASLNSGLHLTLINQKGLVLADSGVSAEDIKNLANQRMQPEVAEALESGSGYGIRQNTNTGSDWLYMALRYQNNGDIGIVRTAKSLDMLYAHTQRLRLVLIGIFVLILGTIGILGIIFARQLSQKIASQQHDLELRVEERTREIQLLQRLASLLAACDSFDEAQQVVQDVVPRILGPMNGGVSLFKPESNQYELCMDWNGLWPGEHAFERSHCWAIRKGKFHFSNDKHSTLYCQHMEDEEHHETLCVPLVSHGDTLGIMHLVIDNVEVDPVFEQLAFSIAEHLGLALANLNLHETLRRQAIIDPLTGLYNRRFLEENLEKEINRSQRHGSPLTVMMLDMDYFKRFNDTFGHDAGDYVLKTLGKTLSDRVRKEDIACRIGGEEMAVILPETELKGAEKLADILCNIIRRMHLTFHGNELGQLTVSIGIANFPLHGQDSASLLKAADVALYNAKNNGRDQYEIYGQDPELDPVNNTA